VKALLDTATPSWRWEPTLFYHELVLEALLAVLLLSGTSYTCIVNQIITPLDVFFVGTALLYTADVASGVWQRISTRPASAPRAPASAGCCRDSALSCACLRQHYDCARADRPRVQNAARC
jgi:hypothetical protein